MGTQNTSFYLLSIWLEWPKGLENKMQSFLKGTACMRIMLMLRSEKHFFLWLKYILNLSLWLKKKKKIQHSHSLLLTKQKIFWRGTLHSNCLLTHSIQIKIQQAIVQNCLSKQKILQSTFFHYSSTQLLARKHEH